MSACSALSVALDLLVALHVRVDRRGAGLQAGHVLLHLAEVAVDRAPERQEALEDAVARLVGAAVLADRLVVDLADRVLDLVEHLQHQLAAARLDAGDGGDRLHPVGRRRRHFAALLVVLLDAGDLVEQLALQRRIALQVAPDQRGEALELALHPAAGLLAAMGEQHRAVALAHLLGGGEQPARADAQRAAERLAERADQLVHRPARGVQEGHREQREDQDREPDVIGPQQPGLKIHGTPFRFPLQETSPLKRG